MNASKNLLSIALGLGLTFSTACSEKSSPLTPLPTERKDSVSEKPSDIVTYNPKVDILFVIDNSGSMGPAQRNLSANAKLFSDAITSMSLLDYHIGVTSTDMADCQDGCGYLMGSPYFVDKSTPNGAAALAANMLLGINGSAYEMMFSPVMDALSKNLTSYRNKDFYRQDAFLAVIFITDAMEQSRVTPADFLKFLVNLKGGDASKVLAYGAIRKESEARSCFSEEPLDAKLETFLASVVNADKNQNNVLSLCAPDYGVRLAQFAQDIVKRSAGKVRLTRIPDVKTIKVTYGTQVIPNSLTDGWVYEVSTNSIILAAGIQWKNQGSTVGLSVDFVAIEP